MLSFTSASCARLPWSVYAPAGHRTLRSNSRPRQAHYLNQGSLINPAPPWPCRGPRATIVCVASGQETGLAISGRQRRYFHDLGQRDELARAAPSDFYELLGLEMECDTEQIRINYRRLSKVSHPDIAGEAATAVSALLNLAYVTLKDPLLRAEYDRELRAFLSEHGTFDGRCVSRWGGPQAEQRAVFVDEASCIGCRNCTLLAPDTFEIEEAHGRARVTTQWGNGEDDLQEAIESCPVDCIYWVRRNQLALLEFVMKACPRENAAMLGRRRSGNIGAKPSSHNPFLRAQVFMRQRDQADIRGRQLDSDGTERSGKIQVHMEELAAAISAAWLLLPIEKQEEGWPSWSVAPEAT